MVGSRADEAQAQPLAGAKRSSDSASARTSQKRSRVSRACDQCRASREKCDGAQPTCHTCSVQGRPCSYNEQPKKRGIQPNYIRTLELMLAWLFRTFPETEARLAVGLPNSDDAASKVISSKDARASEFFHQTWRNGVVCRQIDQILSGAPVEPWKPNSSINYEDEPRDDRDHQSSRVDGSDSDISFTPKVAQHFTDTNFIARSHTSDSSKRVKLPDTAWDLLEYYFAFTQAWLPMTEKPAILKLMYSYPPEGVIQGDPGTAAYAELWSILALAETQLRGYDQDKAKLPSLARSLIPTDFALYETSHIKALLVLGLVEITRKKWPVAWLYIGSAVRILTAKTTENGRQSFDGSNPSFPYMATLGSYNSPADASGYATLSGFEDTSHLKHVTLAAFVLETAVAFELGAPSHLQPSHVLTIGLVDEDGLEEWSPWHDPLDQTSPNLTRAPSRCYSTFNNLVRIAVRRCNIDIDNHSTPGSGVSGNIVLALAENALRSQNRIQPTTLVSQFQVGALSLESRSDGVNRLTQAQGSTKSPPFAVPQETEFTNNNKDITSSQRPLPFMTIPNEGSDSVFGRSPSLPLNQPSVSDPWSPKTPSTIANQMLFPNSGSADNAQSGDIFEQLALLERTDSSQHPQFMQNLGFAPDLDLAEFFGADYQPSDPLLAYMQPSVYPMPQRSGTSGNEGG
ncbi:Hypothetical protein R9X50_00153600 [Acrodontium crateriforme]|uniref:Zn(2)-C6 fungal-type domain-containing protein n=1 Tax=Acrodontium crateriforme TaxID=150365 RepID=A0AAQ3LZX1_9PEZI|nr:Hypothetical protein R9X50_00153600 [Acrodontium crateriforme]